MSVERVIERVLDGEFLIGEADRMMSRTQALLAASAQRTLPGTLLILDGASYRPIVAGDIAGLAANNTPDLLAINYYGVRARTGTKRTAFVTRDARVNGKKLSIPTGLTNDQKNTLAKAFKDKANIQIGDGLGGAIVVTPPAPVPTISFANPSVSVTEGNSGSQAVPNTINVSRNGVTGALVVNLSAGGTATRNTDYTMPTSVTIAAGANSASFDVTVLGDTAVEPDETIIITAQLAAYTSSTAQKTITITNDDVDSGGAAIGPSAASMDANSGSGTLITPIEGVPNGATPTFTPVNSADANKTEMRLAPNEEGVNFWGLYTTSVPIAAGDLVGTLAAPGAGSRTLTITAATVGGGDTSQFFIATGGRYATIGCSIDTGATKDGILEMFGGRLYQPPSYNRAVPGTEVDETPDNRDFVDYQLPGVLALDPKPDVVIVGGFENSTSHGASASNMINGYQRIFDGLKSAIPNVKILIRAKLPGWGEGNNEKISRARQTYNFLRQSQSSSIFMMDETLSYKAVAGDGYQGTTGGGHPGHRGAVKYARALVTPLLPKFTGGPVLPANGDLPSNQNRNPNWDQAGTAGTLTSGGDGVVSTGYSFASTVPIAATLSKGTVASGAAQVITWNGVADVQGRADFSIAPTLTNPIQPGEIWEWIMELEFFAADGVSDPVGLMRVSLNDGSTSSTQLVGDFFNDGNIWPASNIVGRKAVWKSRPNVITTAMAKPVMNLSLYTDARALDIVVKVGRVFLRRTPEAIENRRITLDPITGVAEGTGTGNNIVITARRGTAVGAATVDYALTGTGANPVNGADFASGTLPAGTLTFADGSRTATASLQLAGDSTMEPDEGFTVTLSNPSATWVLGTPFNQSATVFDDDSGVSYDPDAQAYFARMNTAPSTAQKGRIDTLVKALKNGATSTTNIWDKITALWLHRQETLQAALLGVKSNANNFTAVGNGVVFLADKGIGAQGTGSDYIQSAYVPPVEQRDDHAFGVVSISSDQASTAVFASFTSGSTVDSILPRSTSDRASARNNTSISYTGSEAVTDGKGVFIVNRNTSTGFTVFRNAQSLGFNSRASVAPATAYTRIMPSGGAQQIAASFSGRALTAAEITDVTNALAAYAA